MYLFIQREMHMQAGGGAEGEEKEEREYQAEQGA